MHKNVREVFENLDLSEASNKSDALLEFIINAIVNNDLMTGVVLPNENEMCEYLSIGRGTLREVYKALELNGYISRTKSGTTVNSIDDIVMNGRFDISVLLSEEFNIIEFLHIVEPEAVKLAAERASEEELEEIFKVMIEMETANKNNQLNLIKGLNAKFHELIYKASHNSILINAVSSLRHRYDNRIVSYLITTDPKSREFLDLCLYQHYQLFYALKTRNGDEAKRLMHLHFDTDIDYMNSISDKHHI